MRNVLILEDHRETRHFLVDLVHEAFPGCVITALENLSQTLPQIASHQFCLAIVDLSLPDGSGLDVIREICLNQQNCYVIVATIFDDESHILEALRAGAMGYLLKDNHRDFLLNAIRGVTNGLPPISASIIRQMMRALIEVKHPARDDSSIPVPMIDNWQNARISTTRHLGNLEGEQLSCREKEVLHLMAKGFNRAEIAGYLEITTNTSASHIKSIYRKLSIGSRAEAALVASRMGIV